LSVPSRQPPVPIHGCKGSAGLERQVQGRDGRAVSETIFLKQVERILPENLAPACPMLKRHPMDGNKRPMGKLENRKGSVLSAFIPSTTYTAFFVFNGFNAPHTLGKRRTALPSKKNYVLCRNVGL